MNNIYNQINLLTFFKLSERVHRLPYFTVTYFNSLADISTQARLSPGLTLDTVIPIRPSFFDAYFDACFKAVQVQGVPVLRYSNFRFDTYPPVSKT